MKAKTLELDPRDIKSCSVGWIIMNRPPRSPKQPEGPAPELLVPTTLNHAIEAPCPLDATSTLVKLTPGDYFMEDLEIVVEKGSLARRHASELLVVTVGAKTALDQYQVFHFGRAASEDQLPIRNFSRILLRATPSYEVQSTWYINGDFSDELIRATKSPMVIR